MLENSFVKESFNQMATNGFLGDPEGILAYAYIRVSSAQQAEDGRSGLPRQLEHCHQVALQQHLKISWEMVFADDGFSGFEFETRPALSALREEIKKQSRSQYLVIEHLDRLSRNARWHQGFLLDEFSRYHITPIFWKSFGSEIERAVLGTISEEGMRAEIARMMEGMRLKALSGRVTAKRPRFGYTFVDSEGKPSDKARQDTHYAVHPEQSKIVRWVYHCIISEHKSLRLIAQAMNDQKIPTMFAGKL
jgi:DNA invertase Pin-like site-specific DNA recombinase